jgi:membrane protein implicated in regulation of membrane protease activity
MFGLATTALQTGPLGPETLPLLLIVAGLGLSLAEALAPGAHFVVLGSALLAAGIVGLFLPPLGGALALGLMVFLFGALALAAYREFDLYGGGEAGRTSDSAALRGRTGRVTERVTPSAGEVRLDDGGFNPVFSARSVDGEFAEGTEVVVVDPGGGNVLTVESLGPGEDAIDRELRRERERTAAEAERERERATDDTAREDRADGDDPEQASESESASEREREREREP